MTALDHNLLSLLSPTFRRAFPLALLWHILVGALFGVGVYYWPKSQTRPVPPGVVLDVAESLAAEPTATEEADLARALAEIPPESRAVPLPKVPEARSAKVPEPTVAIPDHAVVWTPVMPEVGASPGFVGLASRREAGACGAGLDDQADTVSPAVAGEAGPTTGSYHNLERRPPEVGLGGEGGQPIALYEILPRYPYGARARGEAGSVNVQVHVNENGHVESAVVLESSGFHSLDDSAVAASRKAHFKPAERDGKPVASDMNLQFEFRLEDR